MGFRVHSARACLMAAWRGSPEAWAESIPAAEGGGGANAIDGVAGGIREVMYAKPMRTVADPEGRFDWVNLTSLFAAALNRAATSRNGRSSGGAWKGADGES